MIEAAVTASAKYYPGGGSSMTERELRLYLLDVAQELDRILRGQWQYKEIIDLYNAQTPLPVGYKVKYTDEWWPTYVSAVGIKAGLKDIILPECSCYRMVQLYQARGQWMERDDYVPDIGDIIMYDWQDSGQRRQHRRARPRRICR